MKKKLLAAAIMAAVTLSAASAFAAPVITGDANVEYTKDTNQDANITNRVRLYVDADLADGLYVKTRTALNNNIQSGAHTVDLDRAYIGGKINNVDVKVGRQPIWLENGLIADVDKSGISMTADLNNTKLFGFYGKDQGSNLTAADMNTSYGAVNMGASYAKLGDNSVWGINADTKIADNAVLDVEYVKSNAATENKGYLAQVKFGNAVKKGDIDYAVSYRDIEANAIMGAYSTNSNFADSKGLKLKANYKVTNDATLTVYHDITKTSSTDVDKKRTDVEFSVNF